MAKRQEAVSMFYTPTPEEYKEWCEKYLNAMCDNDRIAGYVLVMGTQQMYNEDNQKLEDKITVLDLEVSRLQKELDKLYGRD